MRKKQVWRYYCDHCKKAGCSPFWMAQHETHCCANPQRKCRMCALDVELSQHPMSSLVAAFDEGGVDAVRALAGGCPACILAAIINWRKQHEESRYSEAASPEFDFTAERAKFFARIAPEF